MKSIEHLPPSVACRLDGLLFDLDETLLDEGALGEHAYSSLFRLRESGLSLVGVTGRPSGWGEVLARQWPVEGIVTENGAVTLFREGAAIRRFDAVGEAERASRRRRLESLVGEVRSAFPELKPADDVGARASDFTIDIGERERVPPETVERARVFAAERGARTTQSSVHLHLTFDGDDKASGAVRFLHDVLGRDPTACRARFAFIGDSENDEACFSAFRTTIAVKNLSGRPTMHPRFVTSAPAGRGFVEAASALVRLRERRSP